MCDYPQVTPIVLMAGVVISMVALGLIAMYLQAKVHNLNKRVRSLNERINRLRTYKGNPPC